MADWFSTVCIASSTAEASWLMISPFDSSSSTHHPMRAQDRFLTKLGLFDDVKFSKNNPV